MKTALIFGSSGLIGNHLLKLILKDNYYQKIKLFVRSNISVKDPRVEIIYYDFKNIDNLRSYIISQLIKYFIESEQWQDASNYLVQYNEMKKINGTYKLGLFKIQQGRQMVLNNKFEEAKKYANILGYNYGSGKWYEASYKIFNKDYKPLKIKKKKKESFIKKKIKTFCCDRPTFVFTFFFCVVVLLIKVTTREKSFI